MMSKYIVGARVDGFECEENVSDIRNSEVVVVINKEDNITDVYRKVSNLIKGANRLVIVCFEDS